MTQDEIRWMSQPQFSTLGSGRSFGTPTPPREPPMKRLEKRREELRNGIRRWTDELSVVEDAISKLKANPELDATLTRLAEAGVLTT